MEASMSQTMTQFPRLHQNQGHHCVMDRFSNQQSDHIFRKQGFSFKIDDEMKPDPVG